MGLQENQPRDRGDYVLIFRAWRINPVTKEKEWAKDHGKKAWPMWVKRKK